MYPPLHQPTARRRRLRAATVAVAVLTATGLAACGNNDKTATASPAANGHYFEQLATETFTPPGGTPTRTPPHSIVGAGSRYDQTTRLYQGNQTSHGTNVAATIHNICTVTAVDQMTCDVRATFGDSTLLMRDTSGDIIGNKDITVPIIGGTGRYAGATGTMLIHPVDDTSDELTINVKNTK